MCGLLAVVTVIPAAQGMNSWLVVIAGGAATALVCAVS
jgi:hypothetical protein